MQDLNPVQTSQTRVCTVANSQEIHTHGLRSVTHARLHVRLLGRTRQKALMCRSQAAPAALCLLYPDTMREEGGSRLVGIP